MYIAWDVKKRTESGYAWVRTRRNCSLRQSEWGGGAPVYYIPAETGRARIPFRPPDWAGHTHTHLAAFLSRCPQISW